MPLCDKCNAACDDDELHEHAGRMLCDDCYMDALSPAKSCDPWATYTASRLPGDELNPRQQRIMDLIAEMGRVPWRELTGATGLDPDELNREIASLRHMELVRAAPDGNGGKVLCHFSDR